MKSKFEEWFQQQPFYLNMRFIYGDQLFTSENGVYRVLAVQIAWATWQEQQKRIDAALKISEKMAKGTNSVAMFSYELHQALKGSEPKEQEPQACDHTMFEKTQFGDLERTFECIFCDHKTTEAWVTTHE